MTVRSTFPLHPDSSASFYFSSRWQGKPNNFSARLVNCRELAGPKHCATWP